MDIEVSIVIVTYNRREKMESLLRSLGEQTQKNFEVLVIIDGSQDGSEAAAESYRDRFTSLRTFAHENRGRSYSRNFGAAQAQCDLLIFFDDDMIALPDCVEYHFKHHQNHPGSMSIGTQEDDPAQIKTDFDRFRYEAGLRWERNVNDGTGEIPVYDTYLTAANFSVSRSLFLELGGFDAATEVVEDFDLAVKARQRNVSLFYNPAARAIHDNWVTCREFVQKQVLYNRSYQKLTRIKPALINKFARTTPSSTPWFKKLVFFIFSYPSLLPVIDDGSLRFFVPKIIRYAIYDFAITGAVKFFPEKTGAA